MNQIVQNMVRGALVGYTAGAARRGETKYRRFSAYEPTPAGMIPSEDFDAWILWTDHLAQGLPPEAICDTRASGFKSQRIEASLAQVNIDAGLRAPMSGSFRNPIATSADSWTRSWYWGIALAPDLAAQYGYWDALCDQGTENAVVVATLPAAMRVTGPIDWVRLAIGLLDRAPTARNVLRAVMNGIAAGESVESIHQRLPIVGESADSLSSNLNLGFIALAILGGAGEFETTLCQAVACGGASHAVATYAGAMAAKWHDGVPEKWLAPLGQEYVGKNSKIATLDAFAAMFPEPPAPTQATTPVIEAVLPIEDSTTGYTTEVAAELPPPLEPPPIQAKQIEIPVTTSRSSIHLLPGAIVTVQYEDPPIVHGDRSLQCIVTFEGTGEDITVQPSVEIPADWQAAHRLVPFRLVKGSKSSFPVVLQPSQLGGHAEIRCLGSEIRIVAFPSQPWAVCGPFPNFDGAAFEKAFKCEDILTISEVFAGRGGGVKWQPKTYAGVGYDVETYFAGVTGALYLFAEFEFEEPGTYRVVAASAPGVVVKINRDVVVKYNNSHTPISRAMLPYVGTFQATGRLQVLVKLVRDNSLMAPLTLYFLNEKGEVVFPRRHFSMPA